MTTHPVLPPNVPLEIFDSLPKSTLYFEGQGQAGNWSDPNNWWGGVAPAGASTAVVPVSATETGSFTTATLMFLGNETVTVNGSLTTLSTNLCESFMVCDQAVAVFNAGSALTVAGALVVGNDDLGIMTANGSGSSFATIISVVGKIGRLDGGIGTLTINGAHWTNADNIFVGQDGAGTLNILGDGQVQVGTDVMIGMNSGSSGQINLSGGGTLSVGASVNLGSGPANPNGSGAAGVSIGTGSLLSYGAGMNILSGNTLSLSGGTLVQGAYATALNVHAGATISGFGTINATTAGIGDLGKIVASGGTLMLNGAVNGSGLLQIAGGSTADLTGSTMGMVGVVFTGQAGTLELTHGITTGGTISDFAAGDSIVMPGVTSIAWNAATKVLALSDLGTVVDRLHFVGSYSSNSFTLSQSNAGAVIGFVAGH